MLHNRLLKRRKNTSRCKAKNQDFSIKLLLSLMIRKFFFLSTIKNTIKHTILLCLMVLYSTFSYGSHAAGMDITYQCISGSSSSSGVEVIVTINTDLYGNEITWTITNSIGVVVASGGPYAFGVNTYIDTVCVPTGTFNFNWYFFRTNFWDITP